MCRNGPLDTLMMFTTTSSVSSVYRTTSVGIVPIIWLYITVVVVVISLSIIISRYVYFLVVLGGIMCDNTGSRIDAVSIILLDG